MEGDKVSTEENSTKLAIYHKMGAAHAKAGEHAAAEAAYCNAQAQCMRLMKDMQSTNVPEPAHCSTLASCMTFTLDRLSNAWKLHQPALASECIFQATEVLKQATLPLQQRLHMRRQDVLKGVKGRKKRQGANIDAQSLLDYTHQLITGHLELDKMDAGYKEAQKTATSLQAQVLRLLSQAYLLSGQAGHALTCVQNVRKLQDPPDDAPGLCLTAIEALIQLGRPQQAWVDAELLGLVLHKGASAALCLAALSAALQAPRCYALKSAADAMLERFAEDATVPPRMVEALLGASEEQKISEERGALALDVARNEKVLQLVNKAGHSTKEQRDHMYTLLRNHANQRLASKDVKASEDFYNAALGYAEADAEADAKHRLVQEMLARTDLNRAQRSRDTAAGQLPSSFNPNPPGGQAQQAQHQLAQEMLAQMDLDRPGRPRQQRSRDTAAGHRPNSFSTNPPEDAAQRAQQAHEEAHMVLSRVRPALNSNDPSVTLERVLDPDISRVSHPVVAYDIWKTLWKEALAVQSPSKRPGDDAKIVANLINMVTVLKKCQEELLTASAAEREYNAKMHNSELELVFKQAEERLEAVGSYSFFGPGPVRADVFARSAWNIGMTAKEVEKTPIAAGPMLRACVSFSEAIPCTTPEQWKVMRDACFMSAQCRQEEYTQHPERKPYCLSQIQDLHKRASAAVEAAMQLPLDPNDLQKSRRCLFSMELNLADEQNDFGRMVPALERAKAQELFAAEDYLHFSIMSMNNPPLPHTASATAALRAALHVMRSQKKWPQMWQLTQTVEELYNLGSDKEKVALLADIGAFVRGVKGPSYPSDEMSWLINTTWTLGSKHAQEQRNNQALPLMAAAIDLMDLSNEFSDSKEMFEANMKKVQREALARPDPPHDASSNTEAADRNQRSRRPRTGFKAALTFLRDP